MTGAVNAYTQTVGIYPESLKRALRDQLPLFGAQRLTSLGYACHVAIGDAPGRDRAGPPHVRSGSSTLRPAVVRPVESGCGRRIGGDRSSIGLRLLRQLAFAADTKTLQQLNGLAVRTRGSATTSEISSVQSV